MSGMFGPGITKILGYLSRFIDWIGIMVVAFEPVGTAVWNIIMALSPLWNALMGIIGQFGSMDSTSGTLATVLNALAFVVGLVATGFGAFIDLIAPLAPWIVGIIALQWAWNIALSANPIGVIVIAIAALIGAIVMAYQKLVGLEVLLWRHGNLLKVLQMRSKNTLSIDLKTCYLE